MTISRELAMTVAMLDVQVNASDLCVIPRALKCTKDNISIINWVVFNKYYVFLWNDE